MRVTRLALRLGGLLGMQNKLRSIKGLPDGPVFMHRM
jgi:hypothetical protein